MLATVILVGLMAVPASAEARTTPHQGGQITLDTRLLSKSGLSAWAIDEYLTSATSLPALGSAFLDAERTYGVNARFLLAAALHESGWGTSYIARTKHNLFGYNAYDHCPSTCAGSFETLRGEHRSRGCVHEGVLPGAIRALVGRCPDPAGHAKALVIVGEVG